MACRPRKRKRKTTLRIRFCKITSLTGQNRHTNVKIKFSTFGHENENVTSTLFSEVFSSSQTFIFFAYLFSLTVSISQKSPLQFRIRRFNFFIHKKFHRLFFRPVIANNTFNFEHNSNYIMGQ